MFTGLVEEIGVLEAVTRSQEGARFRIQAQQTLVDLVIGDSVAVNGVCLTVVEKSSSSLSADAVQETLQRSTLSQLAVGAPVNLECALRAVGRLGGHFVQGHVDAVAKIKNIERRGTGFWLTLLLPSDCLALCVEKGSVAVDGVSLTIAQLHEDAISIAVIPHTAVQTTLGRLRSGDVVNIETDILGKYVHRFMNQPPADSRLTMEKLSEWGF